MHLQVEIVSAEEQVYSGPASIVFVAAQMGEMGILPRHAPLLTRVPAGPVRVRREDGTEEQFFVAGGLLEVQPHQVTVLADVAERTADLDEDAAEQARESAEQTLENATDQISMARARAELVEAQARLELLRKLRAERH